MFITSFNKLSFMPLKNTVLAKPITEVTLRKPVVRDDPPPSQWLTPLI